jgi:hypothetical protein
MAATPRVGEAVAVVGEFSKQWGGQVCVFKLIWRQRQTGEVAVFVFFGSRVVEHARKEKKEKHTFKICSSDKQKKLFILNCH